MNDLNNDANFLVLGAGELGMPVLRALAGRVGSDGKDRVSVLLRPAAMASRDPAKTGDLDELRSLGVTLVPGDLAAASVTELAHLFGRFDTVVSCVGFASGTGTQLKLAQAALAGNVRRYVPWQFGVDYDLIGRGSAQDLFDEQLDVRDLLRGQRRTGWIIVSTGMFTSFLFEPSFGVVDMHRPLVRALGTLDTEVTVTTPDDIGTLTTEILFSTPLIDSDIVHVGGDTLSYGRLAEIIEQVTGKQVERSVWTEAQLAAELAAEPDDSLRKYRAVFAAGRGVAWNMADTFNAQRGIATTDVAAWASARFGSSVPPISAIAAVD